MRVYGRQITKSKQQAGITKTGEIERQHEEEERRKRCQSCAKEEVRGLFYPWPKRLGIGGLRHRCGRGGGRLFHQGASRDAELALRTKLAPEVVAVAFSVGKVAVCREDSCAFGCIFFE